MMSNRFTKLINRNNSRAIIHPVTTACKRFSIYFSIIFQRHYTVVLTFNTNPPPPPPYDHNVIASEYAKIQHE
jgi:hypothetical protein